MYEIENREIVTKWLARVAMRGSGSPHTRRVYTRELDCMVKDLGLSPEEIVKRAKDKPEDFEDLLAVWWSKHTAPDVERFNRFVVLKSFLAYNRVKLNWSVKRPVNPRRTIPDSQTVKEVLNFLSVKYRCIMLIAKDSGLPLRIF